jgi:hypothetical protein
MSRTPGLITAESPILTIAGSKGNFQNHYAASYEEG